MVIGTSENKLCREFIFYFLHNFPILQKDQSKQAHLQMQAASAGKVLITEDEGLLSSRPD